MRNSMRKKSRALGTAVDGMVVLRCTARRATLSRGFLLEDRPLDDLRRAMHLVIRRTASISDKTRAVSDVPRQVPRGQTDGKLVAERASNAKTRVVSPGLRPMA